MSTTLQTFLSALLAKKGSDYFTEFSNFMTEVQAEIDLLNLTAIAATAGASITATSTSSLTIGTGNKVFNIGTGKSFAVGHYVEADDISNPTTNYMRGTATDYSGGNLTLNVASGDTLGSGTIANWSLRVVDPKATQTDTDARTSKVRSIVPADVADGLGLQGSNIASANSLTLPTVGDYFQVTGTTTINSLSARTAGREVALYFSGALQLTHNGTSLVLPGGQNITTVAGDVAVFRSEGSGNWRCIDYMAGGPFTWNAPQRGRVVTLTDGATITPDFSLANHFTVTLGGNRTLANPTNAVAGQAGLIEVLQDGTGGRTLSFGANWKPINGGTASLASGSGARSAIMYHAITSSVILYAIGTV